LSSTVTLQIFDRDYKLSCPADQRDGLLSAARALDARMRELKASDKMLTLDRLAVLAALTFAQELLGKDARFEHLNASVSDELKRLNAALDGALAAA
jgi:cell division protein ZapA